MKSAVPSSETSAVLTATPPTQGGPFASYTFTATPVGGGTPVQVTCPSPVACTVNGLQPGVLYDVVVSAKTTSGSTTPISNSIPLILPLEPKAQLESATADTPTTALVGIEPPTTGPLPVSYTVTLTPVGGGTPITVTTTGLIADFSGLAPGTTYTATAVATMPDGTTKPVLGSLPVSTPVSYNAPALTTSTPTGPTTGAVTIDPPNTLVQPTSYTVTLTPAGGGSPIKVTCANPDDCPVTGLTPDTTYTVVAVGNLPGGGTTPASGTGSIITPTSGANGTDPSPRITDTAATSPFAGTVSIAAPASGPQPTNYTVTLTPIDGGAPITVTCSTPASCPVTGLTPDTTYLVSLPHSPYSIFGLVCILPPFTSRAPICDPGWSLSLLPFPTAGDRHR